MSNINREAWARVVLRLPDNSGIDLNATIAALHRYNELQKLDQEAMAEALDAVMKDCSKHEFITTPILLHSACSKLGADFSLWADLSERGKEVIAAKYEVQKKHGVRNVHYVAPATA
jgi:hypothetical protein